MVEGVPDQQLDVLVVELLTRLRRRPAGASLPVMVLSNYGEPDVIDQGRSLAALAHLLKAETTPGMVIDEIERLLPARSG
jgi:CheY-like chemotaxis protein